MTPDGAARDRKTRKGTPSRLDTWIYRGAFFVLAALFLPVLVIGFTGAFGRGAIFVAFAMVIAVLTLGAVPLNKLLRWLPVLLAVPALLALAYIGGLDAFYNVAGLVFAGLILVSAFIVPVVVVSGLWGLSGSRGRRRGRNAHDGAVRPITGKTLRLFGLPRRSELPPPEGRLMVQARELKAKGIAYRIP